MEFEKRLAMVEMEGKQKQQVCHDDHPIETPGCPATSPLQGIILGGSLPPTAGEPAMRRLSCASFPALQKAAEKQESVLQGDIYSNPPPLSATILGESSSSSSDSDIEGSFGPRKVDRQAAPGNHLPPLTALRETDTAERLTMCYSATRLLGWFPPASPGISAAVSASPSPASCCTERLPPKPRCSAPPDDAPSSRQHRVPVQICSSATARCFVLTRGAACRSPSQGSASLLL